MSKVRFIKPALVMGRGKGKGFSSSGGSAHLQPVPVVTLDGAHSLLEASAMNTVVGNLTVDPDITTLSLFYDAGGKFKIVANVLKATASSTAWATADHLTVTVRSALYGVVTDTDIVITIISADVTAAALSGTHHVADAAAADTVVGNLTSTPSGATFTMVATAGGRFKIVAGVLKTDAVPVSAITGTYNITVRATRGTKTFDQVLTILVP